MRGKNRQSHATMSLIIFRLGLHPSEMMNVIENREGWQLNLELLPPQPSQKSGQCLKKKNKGLSPLERDNRTLELVLQE